MSGVVEVSCWELFYTLLVLFTCMLYGGFFFLCVGGCGWGWSSEGEWLSDVMFVEYFDDYIVSCSLCYYCNVVVQNVFKSRFIILAHLCLLSGKAIDSGNTIGILHTTVENVSVSITKWTTGAVSCISCQVVVPTSIRIAHCQAQICPFSIL